jgi:hypothetical protein
MSPCGDLSTARLRNLESAPRAIVGASADGLNLAGFAAFLPALPPLDAFERVPGARHDRKLICRVVRLCAVDQARRKRAACRCSRIRLGASAEPGSYTRVDG